MDKIVKGMDYQGRHPEAAHAACEIDDDSRPIPGAGAVLWLVWSVAVVLCVLGMLHLASKMGWVS